MGLYVQSGITVNQSSNVDLRRKSLDLLSLDDEVKDDGRKIDLGRDSVIDPTDIAEILRLRKSEKKNRVRKRMNTLLHTHIALIAVSVLSSLDAICVIGQVICDILIMSDKLADYDDLHERASGVITALLPYCFNGTDTSHKSFEFIITHMEEHCSIDTHNANNHSSQHVDIHGHAESMSLLVTNFMKLINSRGSEEESHHRSRRAAGGGHDGEHAEHDVLHEITHTFHIGSLVILSVLLVETFCKIFAMWKHFLDHKLEVFDAFVITVSWCLDVALWEGIWAKPGQEGATLLIFILPWRVIRIVNSFVLVIQEKDLVLLKVVKQRLRSAIRKDKESAAKLDKYRLEVRQLQGLCRKSGADENAIQACCPSGRRRRSSLFQSLTSLASVALVSAMGSTPEAEGNNVSSSESEDENENKTKRTISRSESRDSGMTVQFSLSPDTDEKTTSSGNRNLAFNFDDETVAHYMESDETNKGYKTKL